MLYCSIAFYFLVFFSLLNLKIPCEGGKGGVVPHEGDGCRRGGAPSLEVKSFLKLMFFAVYFDTLDMFEGSYS